MYAVQPHPAQPDDPESRAGQPCCRVDALVDVVVQEYPPLPAASLADLVRRLRHGSPQLVPDLPPALARARQRLAHARIDGVEWYWPPGERLPGRRAAMPVEVRLLGPFDPPSGTGGAFELSWDWTYRFEAYTPPGKRKLGYYALPLSWRDQVIGRGNLAWRKGRLVTQLGYVAGTAPSEPAFARAGGGARAHSRVPRPAGRVTHGMRTAALDLCAAAVRRMARTFGAPACCALVA